MEGDVVGVGSEFGVGQGRRVVRARHRTGRGVGAAGEVRRVAVPVAADGAAPAAAPVAQRAPVRRPVGLARRHNHILIGRI